MRRVVSVVFIGGLLVACGGAQIPQHSGYKNDKSTPWTKAKPLKLNDKSEAKADGNLNYAKFQRARWYELPLDSHGDLDVNLEVTPPGDATNEDFDLAIEILDPGYHVISKSDLEDTEDAGNLQKKKALKDLVPGKYLVHLYLQGRMDTCDYNLKVVFHPTAPAETKSDFPAEVMFPPTMLAQVPMKDDAPADYKPVVVATPKPPVRPRPGQPHQDPPKKPDPKPVVAAMTARILQTSVVSGGTQITVARGTDNGAAPGMKVALGRIGGSLAGCGPRTCTAVLGATPDQVKAAGDTVTISP